MSDPTIDTRWSQFQEIAHSGGKIKIELGRDPSGRTFYSLGWRYCSPVAAAIYGIFAVPPGIPVGTAVLGGLGSPPPKSPVPGALLIFIGSDSEGKFGRQCQLCGGYWRSEPGTTFCPYCAFRGEPHLFITDAQGFYVQQVCAQIRHLIDAGNDGSFEIDMDAVADAVG